MDSWKTSRGYVQDTICTWQHALWIIASERIATLPDGPVRAYISAPVVLLPQCQRAPYTPQGLDDSERTRRVYVSQGAMFNIVYRRHQIQSCLRNVDLRQR